MESAEMQRQKWGRIDRDRMQVSMEAIIYLIDRKGMCAERVAQSTSLTFLQLPLVHHIFSRGYQEAACMRSSHMDLFAALK